MFVNSGRPKENQALAILQYILRSSTDNLFPRFKCLSILAVRKKTRPSQSCSISFHRQLVSTFQMFVDSGRPKENRALAILQYILRSSTDNLCPCFKCLSILAVRKKTGPSQYCSISCALPQTTCFRVLNVYRFWPSERKPGPRNLALYPALFHRQLVSTF